MMNSTASLYSLTASLLEYPDPETRQRLRHALTIAGEVFPLGLNTLGAFSDAVAPLSDNEWEEKYVSTFDVLAACCLDVGYQVFGEDYRRGQLMAQLKELHRRVDNECGSELPDFLPNFLRLLPRLDYSEAAQLAREFVVPAVKKMVDCLKQAGNPYVELLNFTERLVTNDYLAPVQVQGGMHV